MVNNVKDEPPTRLFKLIRIENIRLLGIMILTMELNNIMEPKKDELQTRLFLLANYHLFYFKLRLTTPWRVFHEPDGLASSSHLYKKSPLLTEPEGLALYCDSENEVEQVIHRTTYLHPEGR